MNIRPETFIHALEKRDIYVGSNTACAKGEISSTNTFWAVYFVPRYRSKIDIMEIYINFSDERGNWSE